MRMKKIWLKFLLKLKEIWTIRPVKWIDDVLEIALTRSPYTLVDKVSPESEAIQADSSASINVAPKH